MYFRIGRLCELEFSVGTEVNRKGDFREGFSLTTEQSLGKNEFVMSGGHVTGGSRYMFIRVHQPMQRLLSERTPLHTTCLV